MPPRPGLTTERLVDVASTLIEREGPNGLSLARLAKEVGVKTPSLYNHIAGLQGLQRQLRLRGLDTLAETLSRAAMGRAGKEALVAVANAYRDFAKQQPGLYTLTLRSTEENDADIQQAGRRVVEVVLAVLRGYGLEGEDALHATRYLRSTLHGFVSLEIGEGFGLELSPSDTFDCILDALDHSLSTSFRRDK
ncbi:MAG: WHG domain-containing protein [Trueperaceae bacterium]|nr:WHG domain-containing protein [Trueperaceae bacterium]